MVTLEQPALQNAETIWRFRNDVATRRELGWGAISYGDCLTWIADSVSGKTDDVLFLVRDDKIGDVGFVMFDDTASEARLIVVSIGAAFRGKGYGQQAIKLATILCKAEMPQSANMRRLLAHIRAENYKAVFAFESAGYVEVGSFPGPNKMEYLEFEYK